MEEEENAQKQEVNVILDKERRFRDRLDLLDVIDEHLLRYYRFPRQEIIR